VQPYTIAGRLLHYGRYGKDSDDERLVPVFLGYQTLVRGYSSTSFDLRSCPSIIRQASDCPVPIFKDLLGSRLLVANLEFRFPLFEGVGLDAPAGLPRVELAPFFDAGVAWQGGDKPTFLGGDRNVVTSYGLAVRLNLFGAAIVELDVVHPNDRPGNRWYTQWGFLPGF
jgi:outer membrane protein assembly factor BamA